jgi:hypothetical protein
MGAGRVVGDEDVAESRSRLPPPKSTVPLKSPSHIAGTVHVRSIPDIALHAPKRRLH